MNHKAITQTQLAAADADPGASAPPVGFFAIGVAINVVLLVAYAVWAYRQWKKSDRHED